MCVHRACHTEGLPHWLLCKGPVTSVCKTPTTCLCNVLPHCWRPATHHTHSCRYKPAANLCKGWAPTCPRALLTDWPTSWFKLIKTNKSKRLKYFILSSGWKILHSLSIRKLYQIKRNNEWHSSRRCLLKMLQKIKQNNQATKKYKRNAKIRKDYEKNVTFNSISNELDKNRTSKINNRTFKNS